MSSRPFIRQGSAQPSFSLDHLTTDPGCGALHSKIDNRLTLNKDLPKGPLPVC